MIPFYRISWDHNDIQAVKNVIEKGIFWTKGPTIERFEKRIGEYIGTRYAVTFNSGTSALHAILHAYGIGKDDEVIIPSFTFISTADAPLFVGANPVFADIEEETFGLDPEDIKKHITNKTKAIIVIHYGGCPCKIEEIEKIAKRYGLLLIEDAAGAFGAELDGKKIGTFGDSAIFSFCNNKIITTGEGGCAVTDSKGTYERLKLIRSHGEIKNPHRDYVALGFNFRISDITAAVGISQLKKVTMNLKLQKENALYLTERLSQIKSIKIPPLLFNQNNIYQIYPLLIEKNLRDDLRQYLYKNKILTEIYFQPLHLCRFFRNKFDRTSSRLSVTEFISKKILNLPIYPSLTKKEMDYIINNIETFLQKHTL